MSGVTNFTGHKAVKYLGQHKPSSAYTLPNALVIVPADYEMALLGGARIRANISYIVSTIARTDNELLAAVRDLLVFDSFILDDHWPILHFDNRNAGGITNIPDLAERSSTEPEYKQVDYDDISGIVFFQDELPPGSRVSLSYRILFAAYLNLPAEFKELLEWSASIPTTGATRLDGFFKTDYWRILHTTILIQRVIGESPLCSGKFGACEKCGSKPQPHYAFSRKDWILKYLQELISDSAVVAEYAQIIEAAYRLRHKIAHGPEFDRSTMPEFPDWETQLYGVKRAIEEYAQDMAALHSLQDSARTIAHRLLLEKVFAIRHFRKLGTMKVRTIRFGAGSDGSSST